MFERAEHEIKYFILNDQDKSIIENHFYNGFLNSLAQSKPSEIIRSLQAITEKNISCDEINYFKIIPCPGVYPYSSMWDLIKNIRDIIYLPYDWINLRCSMLSRQESIVAYYNKLIQDNINKYHAYLYWKMYSTALENYDQKELYSLEHKISIVIKKKSIRNYVFSVTFQNEIPCILRQSIEHLCKNILETEIPEVKKKINYNCQRSQEVDYYFYIEFFENEHDFQAFFQLIEDYILENEKNNSMKASLIPYLSELRTYANLPQKEMVLEKRKIDLHKAIYFFEPELPIPIGQEWHHEKWKYFIPEIPEDKSIGACCGFSHIAKNASLAGKRANSDIRSTLIYYGVPNKAGKITTLDDLHQLIAALDLQNYIQYPLQRTKAKKNCEEKNSNGLPDSKPTSEKFIISRSTHIIPSFKPEIYPPIGAYELGEQIRLARAIRTAAFMKFKAEMRNEFLWQQMLVNQSTMPYGKAINSQLEMKMISFDQENYHVASLAQLEEYFSSCTVYQMPDFYLKNTNQNNDYIDNIVSPVNLDLNRNKTSIIKLYELHHVYSYQELKSDFQSLEKQIILHINKNESEVKGITDFPLVFIFAAHEHQITIGYNIQTRKWFIQDINFQPSYEVSTEEVALHVMRNLICPSHLPYIMVTENLQIMAWYNPISSQWILYYARLNEKASVAEKNHYEKVIYASNIIDIRNYLVYINSFAYTCQQVEASVRVVITNWQLSPEFIKTHEITSNKYSFIDEGLQIPFGQLCLIRAASMGNFLEVKRLLDGGVREGRAIHLAVQNNYKEIVILLIQAGCDLKMGLEDYYSYTSLHFAVLNQQYEITELLIKAGGLSLVNQNSKNGTALMLAVHKSDAHLIKRLISAGADLTAKNNKNETAFDIAKKYNYPMDILNLLNPYKLYNLNSQHSQGFFSRTEAKRFKRNPASDIKKMKM